MSFLTPPNWLLESCFCSQKTKHLFTRKRKSSCKISTSPHITHFISFCLFSKELIAFIYYRRPRWRRSANYALRPVQKIKRFTVKHFLPDVIKALVPFRVGAKNVAKLALPNYPERHLCHLFGGRQRQQERSPPKARTLISRLEQCFFRNKKHMCVFNNHTIYN